MFKDEWRIYVTHIMIRKKNHVSSCHWCDSADSQQYSSPNYFSSRNCLERQKEQFLTTISFYLTSTHDCTPLGSPNKTQSKLNQNRLEFPMSIYEGKNHWTTPHENTTTNTWHVFEIKLAWYAKWYSPHYIPVKP